MSRRLCPARAWWKASGLVRTTDALVVAVIAGEAAAILYACVKLIDLVR